MWRRKSEKEAKQQPFPGKACALDGHSAAYAVERLAGDAVVVQSVPELAETGAIPEDALQETTTRPFLCREVTDLHQVVATLCGFATQGLRASAFVNSLSGIHEALLAAPGGRLPFVVRLTSRASKRQAGSLRGGHGDYFAAADTGLFQLFAKDVQEAADFTLIAHRVAELSLTPGICAQDFYGTSHSIQSLRLVERELVERFLGRPGDTIVSPTPSQKMLFGNQRRRIPVLLDVDHPAGIGGVQDGESYLRALAAQRSFFAAHIGEIIDAAMREFEELTGRAYGRCASYRTDDADAVVVAQGCVVDELAAVVDYLRDKEKMKVGVVGLSVLRPFPGSDLTRIFKNKKALTVLERTDQPLAEDLPLATEIRCAIDKAVENGMANEDPPPYPDHETYRKPGERPRVYSGVYGVGRDVPTFGELLAVFRNMLPRGDGKKRFYVGADSNKDLRRFPHLQTVEQQLRHDYPDLEQRTLAAAEPAKQPEQSGHAFEVHSASVQGGLFAVNIFAQTLADVPGCSVATFPDGGLERNLQPTLLTVRHDTDGIVMNSRPVAVDAVLVSDEHLLEHLPSRSALKERGALVVESVRGPEELWRGLSNRTVRWIRERELRFYVIDSRKIASETASRAAYVDQLAVWALLGAWLKAGAVAGIDMTSFLDNLRSRVEHVFGAGHDSIEEIVKAAARGATENREVGWESWGDTSHVVAEAEPPWTVQQLSQREGNVFDPTRFWHSVGYLYDSGQADETLTDPFLATGMIPAGSSAFRDMTPYRLRVPRWLPENCTGCGMCWAQCPESALPPAIHYISSLIDTAMSVCKKTGATFVQMTRVGDHLAKEAYRIMAKDQPSPYISAGALLDDAFSKLMKKMNIDGEKGEALKKEFEQIRGVIDEFPVARTEAFFDEAHKNEKGTGSLLTIALNPLSCTACGVCLEVCPDDAFEWADQTGERLERYEREWRLQMAQPVATGERLEKLVSDADPDTSVRRLLDNTAYHSLVGGDGSFPGNGAKIAVHLLTAAVESVMRPRFQAHVARLDDLIKRVEDTIQGKVEEAVKINDFEQFSERLTQIEKGKFNTETLSKLFGDEESARGIDRARLNRLSILLSELREQRRCYLHGAGGVGRSRMVLTIDGDSAAFWNGTYPYNPHSHPWLSQLAGDAPALAEGVFEGITRRLADEVKTCRLAELELADGYVPEEHDAVLGRLTWRDFTDEEWERIPPVVVLGHVGTTSWDSVSRLLSTGYPIKIAMIDAQGPAIMRKGSDARATSNGAGVAFRALARQDAFVMQTTIGHPGDLIRGVVDGVAGNHAALFQIYSPDPQLSGIAPERVAMQARLAYESRAIPMFRRDPAAAGLDIGSNADADKDWAAGELDVRDSSGVQSSISVQVTLADWAVKETRFQEHFTIVPRGHHNERMMLLSEYLDLSPAEREGREPYIEVTDENQRHLLAVVSPEMVQATEEAARFWRSLRSLATQGTSVARQANGDGQAAVAQEVKAPPPAAQPDAAAQQVLVDRLLWLCGYAQDPDFFKQSLREFMTKESTTRLEE